MNRISSFLVLLAAVMISCSEEEQKESPAQQAQPVLKVNAYKVKTQPFSSRLVTTGNVLAYDEVTLKAPIGGTVLSINFKEGQKVKKGYPIIHLDDRAWKAQLVGLKAELNNAEKDYERKKTLLEIEGSSQQDIDEAFTAIEKLKSQIQQLEVNIRLANVEAPFTGNLGMRDISPGAYLAQGDIITTLVNIDKLRLDFAVPQQYQNSLKPGSDVLVYNQKDTLRAKVYAVNPRLTTTSRTLNVRAQLDQSSEKTLLPGTYVEVAIPIEAVKDALLVPTQAVVPEIDDQTIYVYENGVAKRKKITLGNRSKDSVNVIEGIAAGDTIITTGLLKIKDGVQVDVQLLE